MAGVARVRPVEPGDEGEWRRLFAGYREFYELPADDDVVDRVWSWLHDAEVEVHGLVAEVDGVLVGLAHHRAFHRPSTGTVGTWLDDLFVDPAVRGSGAGRALVDRLAADAAAQGRSVVRWITAEDNDVARGMYDSMADATRWVTYDRRP
ncbi:Acetyltransferase (GNAT) family protein [Nocardioides exalbidus]|uniref:Acetyltransferase (GNAT) family protein n=1 Tax=Nocardioides exalbidus TaxID=402596 RepID=A0A1H4V6J4_9ACTN|nr:GNAT family N-acetyltransferase [Nocardioides exalbidus]SEC76536.1 Acetyltransferase (GNAT) family protein [Nocardioides exalbidus]